MADLPRPADADEFGPLIPDYSPSIPRVVDPCTMPGRPIHVTPREADELVGGADPGHGDAVDRMSVPPPQRGPRSAPA